MIVFCTYCSKQKSTEVDELPAIYRYQSERITKVYRAAQEVGVRFLILSGKFGLLTPEKPISNYDHLLAIEEVGQMVEKLVWQLEAESISGIVYFTQPLNQDMKVRPYHDTLAAACARLSIPFLVSMLTG